MKKILDSKDDRDFHLDLFDVEDELIAFIKEVKDERRSRTSEVD